MALWTRERSLYYFNGEQRSEEWFLARKNRLTASNVSAAVGRTTYGKKEVDLPSEIAANIRGETEKTEINEAQAQGINYEAGIRVEYEKRNGVVVREVGFVFNIDRPHLGVSPDGLVGEDGLIEIKCPQKIYERLLDVCEGRTKPYYLKDGIPSYIFPSHYDQMQTQMAVLGKKWCDYVVYCPADEIYIQHRVPFNPRHWKVLSLLIDRFIDRELKHTEAYVPVLD